MTVRLSLVCFASLLLVACVKPPTEKEKSLEDYGPQITYEKLEDELNSSEAPNPYEIRQGDMALLVREQIIERETRTLNKTKSEVMERTETDLRVDYKFKTLYEEWKDEQPQPNPTEKVHPVGVNKPSNTAFGRVLEALEKRLGIRFSFFTESQASPQSLIDALHQELKTAQAKLQPNSGAKFTYHNFSRTPVRMPIPPLALKRPGCGRRVAEGCSVPITGEKIRYDLVKWVDGKAELKVSVYKVLSPELPYFFYESPNGPSLDYFLVNCSEGIVDIGPQKVHLIDCVTMADMYLTPPPSSP